jgi:hypothetical protein
LLLHNLREKEQQPLGQLSRNKPKDALARSASYAVFKQQLISEKQKNMIKLNQNLKDELWWLIISADYDYSRIIIADHEICGEALTLWLEDKQDFKESLDECLELNIGLKHFAKVITDEKLNSYEGSKVHPRGNYVYKTRIQINAPIKWYREDASPTEQRWAREAVLKYVLTQLVESEVVSPKSGVGCLDSAVSCHEPEPEWMDDY